MATFVCRVQFLDDTDPFNSTNFPEPTRPPLYTFREDIPLNNQIAGVHRLLKAPQKPDDCALQLSHNGSYLDLESTLAEQRDELEGFQEEGGRGKKHSIILRTQLSVRVHACIEKLYNSTGRELRRALFSLKQIFQDDKDLVHEFVVAEGLTCLIKVGAEADQNYQNYILRALGQIMLYVDGMNGLISHNETVQWLYTLVGSKFRLVVKTALKLLLVFVEYTESNATLLIKAVNVVDAKRDTKLWSNVMEILDEKDGVDTELLVYAMTLINKTLAGLPDQDSYYDMVDCLEEQGIEAMAQRTPKQERH
ncbi:FH1/FH2 domain-containing protein 3 Formactin-2 Formin-like protein overexpressed in spleen 2 [Larimichthys crocea]|uniref:FH1/FH2 domain-containing protein 3 Formactin-2 Formin-like protein overexpressed in spleen 2 n=1 Tax=Larimichthys crocea TaxID=215358 RepID=A0A6G0IBV6_LARCR|nr:FH1/FH2 domain-containing protein 3 Formactin-2 Formin-like protein overexpressed in spleen 2 [Larimichthys crocea]